MSVDFSLSEVGLCERTVARNGVVATDHGQCSTIGRDILRKGGHAVDAAVAAALCLGVVSPASSGIGGGAFMLVRSTDGKTEAYDMRETAPALAFENMYAANAALKASGVLSVAVPGDICYNKQLAKTLRTVSRHGASALYKGQIGVRLVEDVKKAGGILTLEDLQNYQVKVREPVSVDFMGVEIFSMPPPSSGGAAMSLRIESLKNAFAVRMNLGDPDYVNIKNVVKDMLSKDFAAGLRKSIFDNTTFNASHYGGRWNQMHDHGTSHISIVDRERNAVSMTTTINAYFGSKFLSPRTGILLNNEMDDFSMPANTSQNVPPPAPANFIHPGKRPLSSMTPTIVLKGAKLKAVVGASGGSLIIAGTTEVLLNHLARGMDPLSSVLAPRTYHQLIPNVVQYENWTVPTGEHFEVPAETRTALEKKGHVLASLAGGTICQFVVQELESPKTGHLVAVSDPRKGGFPAGF
ncbi:UNVERIFIED_CONTAM: Glutathione hydrolase 1 [Sesamum angustifolium]|uniref:Glutathione hydrolase 1 n=1 Tax=Sesamum angustifolium TaxID=2727405 RepID=A0AAW2IS81_9LAMI